MFVSFVRCSRVCFLLGAGRWRCSLSCSFGVEVVVHHESLFLRAPPNREFLIA